jgi:hypothetical protein
MNCGVEPQLRGPEIKTATIFITAAGLGEAVSAVEDLAEAVPVAAVDPAGLEGGRAAAVVHLDRRIGVTFLHLKH